MLDSLMLTNGPLVEEFEKRVAAVAGTRHCVATCNATVGLQIAAKASGVGAGDEVIIPSFTWVATAHALSWIGIVPVFCDVDQESGNIDPIHAEKLIGPATRAILAVHVFGRPCPVEPLTELAARHRIPLLFDSAHAIGCTYGQRPVGGFGDAEVFSFHATKVVNSFEGGAIVTNDDGLAERARAMRNFGIGEDREVGSHGTNAKLSEASAAMGLTSLEIMDDLMAVNRRNYELYQSGLAGMAGFRLRPPDAGERVNLQYVVIEVDATVAGVHRDELFDALGRENVLARKYFFPICHQVEPYRADLSVHAPLPLPCSETLADRVLALPTGTSIGAAEISGICDIIRRTVR